jgi:nucleoside 2-deoxyribosyltransferase
MPIMIYLAGPDVFLPDAIEVGRQKMAICQEFGFEGLFPVDNDPGVEADAAAIFRANCAQMKRADIGVFNLSPFRGPSADAGTVFELGFLFSQNRPVYGYSNAPGSYITRVGAAAGPLRERGGRPVDRDGRAVENFGLADNLMIVEAIRASGGAMAFAPPGRDASASAALETIPAFRACLEIVRQRFH